VAVVGPCARETGAREGLGQKTRNRAAVARLRARRAKRLRERVRRGGTVVRPRWWRWWGGAFAKREARSGAGGPKKPKPSAVARFRGAVGLQELEGGAVGLQVPLPC
jgi:hypothetical protein